MEQSQLLAHCGSSTITREKLKVIQTPAGSPTHQPLMVKKVVRRAEVKGHRHGFRVSGVLLIEAADNPRPVHKRCHQTQHPKQDHHLESPRARPESQIIPEPP